MQLPDNGGGLKWALRQAVKTADLSVFINYVRQASFQLEYLYSPC